MHYFCFGKMRNYAKKEDFERDIEHFYETNKGALLVTGARQIGKTYSIRQFAAKHFNLDLSGL